MRAVVRSVDVGASSGEVWLVQAVVRSVDVGAGSGEIWLVQAVVRSGWCRQW